jgi:hypothetical protein
MKGVYKMFFSVEPPERYKNQLNKKSANENYRDMKNKKHNDFINSLFFDSDFQKKYENELFNVIQNSLEKILNGLKV